MAAGSVAELNRFKRRVIRAVARMVRQGLQDQSAEDEMWKALQKEVGCDCKLLWERMRTLTLKKMKRLLPAEDRLDAIAAVAQMNLTDWLLFDLVLVHEDIEVISEKSGSQCQTDLVNLVQVFDIEGKRGEDLTNAWTAATFHYNSFGRQCSPMLLQRRWFQLKKATRTKFYAFWFQYRGNVKLLNDCKDQMPNDLHGLIAQRYPYVVTRPFQEWEELIKERMVILPEEFQAKIRKSNAPKKIDKNEPDLVLVEPQIETIDLGVESDSESGLDSKEPKKAPETENNPTPEPPITIKQEILDQIEIDDHPGLDELIDKETELVETNENIETVPGDVNNEKVDETEVSSDTPEKENEMLNIDTEAVTDGDEKICDDVAENNTVEEINTVEELNTIEEINTAEKISTIEEINTVEDINAVEDNDAVVDLDAVEEKNTVEEINTAKEDEVMPKICSVAGSFHEEIGMPQITNVVGNVKADNETLPAEASEGQVISTDDIVCEPEPEPMEVDETVEEPVSSPDFDVERPAEENNVIDLDEAHAEEDETPKVTYESHTEYVDEILQSVLSKVTKPQVASTSEEKPKEETVSNSYMDLPTDIDFEDDGIEYVDDGIEFNEADDDDSDGSTAPNKPEIKEELGDADGTPKFDLKLLMQPLVYTTKLDSMNVFKNKSIESVSNKDFLDKALLESKPVNKKSSLDDTDTILKENFEIKKEADDESCHEEQSYHSESEDEDTIPKENKIKPTSALFKKPRSRSYNPIQLCKNPDFNTRLKRLTVGFLSSTRNRSLLRMLKPMTIDLSKTFEGKLINGTMYLKSWDGPTVKSEPIVEDNSEQASAVLPSAMSVQSLINNTQVNLGDVLPTMPIERTTPIERAHKLQDLILMDRQRSFNLPNINDVRRMNQKLLVAEVTPMMRKTSDSTPPVQICTQNKKEPINTQASNEKKPASDINFGYKDVAQKKVISISGATQKDVHQVQNIQIPKSKAVSEIRNPRLNEKQPQNAGNNEVVAGPSSYRLGRYAEKANSVFSRGKFNNGYKLLPEKRLLPWNKLRTGPNIDDSLLTLDTLNKMLSIVSSKDPVEAPKTSKKLKRSLEKKRLELEKRMHEFERKKQITDGKTVNAEDTKEDNNVSKEDTKGKVKIPKIKTVVKQSLYGEHCCWAGLKLVDPTKAVSIGHRCPRLCKCCCRKKLAEYIINQRNKEQGILISDDDEMKNVSETIENVVKITKRQKTKTTRSVQCNIKFASQDTGSKEAEVALKSIMPNETPSAPVARLRRKSVYISRTNSIRVRPNLETIDLDDADNNIGGVGVNAPKHKYPSAFQEISKVGSVPQGHIVIDATNKLTINTRAYTQNANKLKEKILYLKHATRKEDGPIYLGKNKILLTNIKFPRKIPFHEPPSRVEVPASHFPQVLPPGVQLVLLPTGEVTYISEPGATIDDEQMNVLPAIIEAVQKQLNAGSIPEVESISQPGAIQMEKNNATALVNVEDTSTGNVSLNKSNSENDHYPNMEDQNNQPDLENIKECINAQILNMNTASSVLTEETISLDDENETKGNETHVPRHAERPDVENIVDITTEDNANNKTPENAVPLEQESENVAEKQTESENVTGSTSRKSLLSDLMAMSGIWDDIQPEPQIHNENITEGIVNQLPMEVAPAMPLVAPLLETPPLVPISDVVPVETAVDSTPAPLAPISPIKSLYSLGNQMPELTPITSFAQLKYACEQNGKFFKLDLDLGTISSICVSIKPKMRHVKPANLAPKSVIDLTEDEDSVQPVEVREDPGAPSTLEQNQALANRSLLKTAQPHNKSATPLKLFRSVRILRREGSKNREHTILLPAETKTQSSLLINRRKQNIETRQSPQPSEEPEYLDEDSLDSGSLDKYIWKEDGLDLLSTDDDSSDDEPLAAKSKRMKMNYVRCDSSNNNPGRNLVKDAMDAALLNQSNESLPPDAEKEQPQFANNVEPQPAGHPESELVDNQLASNTEPHLDTNMEPQLAGNAPALPQSPDNEELQLEINGQPHLPGVYGPESPRDEERDSPMIPFMPNCEDDDDDDGDCILGF